MSLLCFAVPMFTSVQLRGFLEVSIEPLLDATETSKHYLALCRVLVPLEVVLGRGRSQGPKRDLGSGEIQVPRIQLVSSRTWPCGAETRT